MFDTTIAASFSILESQREFVQRYRRKHHDANVMPMFTSSCPGKKIRITTKSHLHRKRNVPSLHANTVYGGQLSSILHLSF